MGLNVLKIVVYPNRASKKTI